MERMQRIAERLKRGTYPNCQNLGADLDASYKTIHHNIEFMKYRLTLPIEFNRKRNGYYHAEAVSSFPTLQITEGKLELSLHLTSLAEALRWIRSWSEHARAVAPKSLVAEARRVLKLTMNRGARTADVSVELTERTP